MDFTFDIGFLLILLAVMVTLFLTEKISIDLTAFCGLVVLVLFGYLTVDEAFSGVSSPAVVTMFSTFFIAAGLKRTGLTDRLSGAILGVVGHRQHAVVAGVMIAAALCSSVMSNVAATAILLPAVSSVSAATGIPNSKLLIPLAFGTVLGGMSTPIGTPANILAVDYLQKQGLEPFQFLDFGIFGFTAVALGTVYMAYVGVRFLPVREQSSGGHHGAKELAGLYRLHERLFTLRVPKGSEIEGLSLGELGFGTLLGAEVLSVTDARERRRTRSPDAAYQLRAGDTLLVGGRLHELERLFRLQHVRTGSLEVVDLRYASDDFEGFRIFVRGRGVEGLTLEQLKFRDKYRAVALSIQRGEQVLRRDIGRIELREGDSILALGTPQGVNEIRLLDEFVSVTDEHIPLLEAMKGNVFTVSIEDDSPLIGMTLAETGLGRLAGLTVVGIEREGALDIAVSKEERIEAGQTLLIAGEEKAAQQLALLGELKIDSKEAEPELETAEMAVFEAVLPPRSSIVGKTLKQIRFRERYGFMVLALWKESKPLRAHLADRVLAAGDALLLQGPRSKLAMLADDSDFVVLSEVERRAPRDEKAPFVLAGVLIMVLLAALDLQPVHMAAFIAATFIVVTGALRMGDAYREVEWRVLFMVAALLPVGIAVEKTGTAAFIAEHMVAAVGNAGPYVVLLCFALLASAISQTLDGSLTVVLLSPIVLQTAGQMEVSPYPFMMAIALGASVAFLTPFSHKANLLVMAPGNYRPSDFFKVGAGLSVVVIAGAIATIPLIL